MIRGVELLLYPQHTSFCMNTVPLPVVPRISPIDIPQNVWNNWIESAQMLDDIWPLCDGPQLGYKGFQ